MLFLERIFLLLESSFEIAGELEESLLSRLGLFQLFLQLTFLLDLSSLIGVDLLGLYQDVEVVLTGFSDGGFCLRNAGKLLVDVSDLSGTVSSVS